MESKREDNVQESLQPNLKFNEIWWMFGAGVLEAVCFALLTQQDRWIKADIWTVIFSAIVFTCFILSILVLIGLPVMAVIRKKKMGRFLKRLKWWIRTFIVLPVIAPALWGIAFILSQGQGFVLFLMAGFLVSICLLFFGIALSGLFEKFGFLQDFSGA